MLTTATAIKGKIAEQAALFHQAYQNKQYTRAKYIYDKIFSVVTMLEFTEEEAAEVYGNRAYKTDHEELRSGLLNEYVVSKIHFETCVKRGSTETMELYKCANCPLKTKK